MVVAIWDLRFALDVLVVTVELFVGALLGKTKASEFWLVAGKKRSISMYLDEVLNVSIRWILIITIFEILKKTETSRSLNETAITSFQQKLYISWTPIPINR